MRIGITGSATIGAIAQSATQDSTIVARVDAQAR